MGIKLSAFNLAGETPNKNKGFTVETIFQSSKVFENGDGPYREVLTMSSREAKRYKELKNKTLSHFDYFGTIWELKPTMAFYDWVYINILEIHNKNLADDLMDYDAFTDIEFNHEKSKNCQAHAVALYKALRSRGGLIEDFCNQKLSLEERKRNFLRIWADFYIDDSDRFDKNYSQASLLHY